MSVSAPARREVTLIQPSKGWAWLNLRELWRYRELLYFLIWRDVKVRYKQTLLGAGWAVLKPFLSMVIFTVIFGNFARIPTDGAPAPIFYFTALLPWLLFQDGVSKAALSLVAGRSMITKVYFPRLVVPAATILAGLVDFAIAAGVLAGMLLYFRVAPAPEVWTLPLFLLLTLATAFGAGLWLSALNVAYRDIGYVTPFILQAWMYASPVVYSTTILPQGMAQWVLALNPMAGVVQGFRWAVLGVGAPAPAMLAISTAVSLLMLASGLLYFRRVEKTFADVI